MKFTVFRRRKGCRSGKTFSNRGPGPRSRVFKPGRADLWTRCHSSMGTSTAASTPRRVTTCGPFLRVVSSSSLNLAFASCTFHAANTHLRFFPEAYHVTSHLSSHIGLRVGKGCGFDTPLSIRRTDPHLRTARRCGAPGRRTEDPSLHSGFGSGLRSRQR